MAQNDDRDVLRNREVCRAYLSAVLCAGGQAGLVADWAAQWSLYAGLSIEAAVDLIVAIAQVLLLRRMETGIRR